MLKSPFADISLENIFTFIVSIASKILYLILIDFLQIIINNCFVNYYVTSLQTCLFDREKNQIRV